MFPDYLPFEKSSKNSHFTFFLCSIPDVLEQGLPHSRSFVNNELINLLTRPVQHFQETHKPPIPLSYLMDQNVRPKEISNLVRSLRGQCQGKPRLWVSYFSMLSSSYLCPSDGGRNGCQVMSRSCYIRKLCLKRLS